MGSGRKKVCYNKTLLTSLYNKSFTYMVNKLGISRNKRQERPQDSDIFMINLEKQEWKKTYDDFSKLLKMMKENPKKFKVK